MDHFGTIMFTQDVLEEQRKAGSDKGYAAMLERPAAAGLGPDERAFIETRTSFYIASLSQSGWPYVQHRGGAAGFLRVLGPSQIGFADYKGNRQYVTTGNIAGDDRVSLFLMDYPRRARLKLLGRMRVMAPGDPRAHSSDADAPPHERMFLIDIAAFDWNCPKYIDPRYTQAELAALIGPRLAALEQENARLKAELDAVKAGS